MANEDQKAEFAVGLQSDDLIGAAESAAKALENLRGSIDEDVKALQGMQRAMKNIQGGGAQFDAQVKRLAHDIDAKKKSIAGAQSSYVQLGGSFVKSAATGRTFEERIKSITKAGAGVRATETRFAALTKVAQGMPGPLGAIVGRFAALRPMLTSAAGGTALVVAGFVALVAAVAVATAALYRYGKAQAEARRNELLRLEGLSKLRFWFQRIPGNAKEMQGSIDRVAASSSLGRDKIAQYNEELFRMGLRGANLNDALDAFQIKAATQGEAAARAWAGWAAGAAITGGSVKRLADRVRSQLGGIAQKQLESTEAQALKLKEAFDALFADLKMDDYLHQWRLVNDLLGQSTASGRALKQIMNLILQPFIDSSAAGAPILKRFFQGVIIETQRIVIGFLKLRRAWRETFGGDDGTRGFDKMKIAVATGKILVLALAMSFMFLAGWVLAATWPILLAAAAIYALINTGRLLYQLWEEIDWSGMGTAIWEGIVGGLKKGWDAVTSVAEGLADDVTKAFKGALGIASPSRVFAELGLEIPRGIALGVDRGKPLADDAVARVVPDPSTPSIPRTPDSPPQHAPPVAAAARAMSAPPTTLSFSFGDIVIGRDVKDPQSAVADVKRELERMLEGVALQLGARVAGDAT